jgi:hypothetical protein
MVAVTHGAASAPPSCTFQNSDVQVISGGDVVLGIPSSPGCLWHRVCTFGGGCASDYSPGKVFSRCLSASQPPSITCTFQ